MTNDPPSPGLRRAGQIRRNDQLRKPSRAGDEIRKAASGSVRGLPQRCMIRKTREGPPLPGPLLLGEAREKVRHRACEATGRRRGHPWRSKAAAPNSERLREQAPNVFASRLRTSSRAGTFGVGTFEHLFIFHCWIPHPALSPGERGSEERPSPCPLPKGEGSIACARCSAHARAVRVACRLEIGDTAG